MNRILALLCTLCFGSSLAAAQGVVLHEDFESGAPGWTFTELWHIEPDTGACSSSLVPFPSPGHAAWYGSSSSCSYATTVPGGGGLHYLTPLVLPAAQGSTVLRYRRHSHTEGCFNFWDLGAAIVTDTNGITLIYGSDCDQAPGWAQKRVDLTSQVGVAVQLHFVFAPGDSYQNSTLGWWIDDVEIAVEPGVVTCVADASCPCAQQWNYGISPALFNEDSGGCKHSGHLEAQLFADGAGSVSSDTVELVAADLPASTTVLYVQGTTTQAAVFGDGRRCVGGPFVRLAIHNVSGGRDVYPRPGETALALRGSVPAGGASRTYQVYYRDAANYCTSSTFNTSNGYVIAWQP